MKKRVNIFTHEFYPKKGGIGTYCAEIANAAVTSGFDVQVFAPFNAIKPNPEDRYTLKRCKNKGTHRKKCVRKSQILFLQNILRFKNCYNYVPEPGPMLAIYWLNKYLGYSIPNLTLTFHGTEIMRWRSSKEGLSVLNKLVQLAKTITCVSNYVAQLLFEVVPSAKAKTLVIPNAPKQHLVNSVEQLKEGSVKTENKVQFLTVARLHPRKGIDYTLKILEQIPNSLKNKVEYSIVGTGDDSQYIERLKLLAEETGISVKFRGELDENTLIKEYKQADVFLMTSMPYKESIEGFGLVYLEAAVFKLPSIAHNIGGVSDAIIDEETGYLVSPNDERLLIKRIVTLIESQTLRLQLGESAYLHLKNFSWLKNVQKIWPTSY